MSVDCTVTKQQPPLTLPAGWTASLLAKRLSGKPWTTHEVRLLQDIYPHKGASAAAAALPERGLHAIYAKALRLGLSAPDNSSRLAGRRFERVHVTTPQIDQMIRDAYTLRRQERGFCKRLAIEVDRPKWWVVQRAIQLGCGVQRISPVPWSKQEVEILEQCATWTPQAIARRLKANGFKRTATAVAVQLKRREIDRHDPDRWTANELGPLLGVNPKTVADWIQRRGLPAKKLDIGRQGEYQIKRAGLRRWLKENHAYVDLRKVDQPWLWSLVLGLDN